MNQEAGSTVTEQLRELSRLLPGRNDAALLQARRDLSPFTTHSDPNVQEAAAKALDCFDIWFSAHEWRQHPNAESRLAGAIGSLGIAIEKAGNA